MNSTLNSEKSVLDNNFQPASMILQNHRFVASKNHLYSNLNGKGVILSMKSERYYGVNTVGAFIWEVIQKPASYTDIQAKLMQEFDVDEEVCEQEVSSFLKKLMKEELVDILDEKDL
ncbi:MAG: lasso peptide biosynthesis PqqD family chaperone [Pyrinomonadaceae bacterium]